MQVHISYNTHFQTITELLHSVWDKRCQAWGGGGRVVGLRDAKPGGGKGGGAKSLGGGWWG